MSNWMIGKANTSPEWSHKTRGVTLQIVLGDHNAGWFISKKGRQLQIGMGHLSVLMVDVDLQVMFNRINAVLQRSDNE